MSCTSPWPTIITIYGLRTLPTPQPSKNGSRSSTTDVNGIDGSKAWQSGWDALGSARADRLCSSVPPRTRPPKARIANGPVSTPPPPQYPAPGAFPMGGVAETRKAPSNEGALRICWLLLQGVIACNSRLYHLLLQKAVRSYILPCPPERPAPCLSLHQPHFCLCKPPLQAFDPRLF